MQTLRYWDYYGLTNTFTDLYDRSKSGETFSYLYDTITSRENILLSYRTIKSNKGSITPGTDSKTINDIKKLSEDELVYEIQEKLKNYRPKKVRRRWEFLVSLIELYNNALNKCLNPSLKRNSINIAMDLDLYGQPTTRWQGSNS